MRSHIEVGGQKFRCNGWRRDRPDHRDKKMAIRPITGALPEVVDNSRDVTVIEDQLFTGSCVAHAATSMCEAWLKKHDLPAPQLSRLFVYFAGRVEVEKSEPWDDSGMENRSAMKVLAKYGVPAEASWPFLIKKLALRPPKKVWAEAKTRQVTGYRRCSAIGSGAADLDLICYSLAQGLHVLGGFEVPASIESEETRKTGVVRLPEADEEAAGGHSVLFVGYDRPRKLLRFVNSWGVSWGAGGYGLLPFEYVTRGLADDFWALLGAEVPTSE